MDTKDICQHLASRMSFKYAFITLDTGFGIMLAHMPWKSFSRKPAVSTILVLVYMN
jgi:hypothetical protein